MASLREQLELIKAGKHPRLVADLKRCAVVLHDQQALRGWCVLIYKKPEQHLADLPLDEQAVVFREVALVGNAVRSAFAAARINYACLGNVDPQIHWHVIPRYAAPQDPDPTKAVWSLPESALKGNLTEGEVQDTIMRLRALLGK